ENFLSEFPGCLLIVSHDRYFMDRLVDHLFVFEGDGAIRDFPGNYSQYRLQQTKDEPSIKKPEEKQTEQPAKEKNRRQLTFKEKREFELLEKEISDLSKEKEVITEKLNSGSTPFEQLQQLSVRIGEVTRLLDEKELRWLELSEIE
ncbi:MAG TPA: ABC transporter ATP-binding protein, partial [Chitinophagaceae bacterium]|nr:ABC transporter ATP-binding protein [Chitinophagaceae bacterium]